MEWHPDVESIPQIKIEGRVETAFTEITAEQTQPIVLPPAITWDTARLRFEQVKAAYSVPSGPFGREEQILLYEGILDYRSGGNNRSGGQKLSLPLSSLVQGDKPIFFAGSYNGFYAHDPEMVGRSNPFYVVGIQPGELERNMARLCSIYHELGHVFVYSGNYDVQLFQAGLTLRTRYIPRVKGALRYAQFMDEAIEYDRLSRDQMITNRTELTRLELQYPEIAKAVSLFHERFAWAGGGRLKMRYNLPTGFEHSTSLATYGKFCLGTYAKAYHDKHFVDGWAPEID